MKNFIALVIATALLLFMLLGYATSVNSNLSQNIVRLHIIANSDSKEDQTLKMVVRDAILKKSQSDFTKKADVTQKLDIYKQIAQETITENGYDYNVDVCYGNFRFPTKHYKNLSLPAGFYDAVRVTIGNGEGKNWWCVMFPPLCFVDGTTDTAYAEEKLSELLNDESYDIITSGQSGSFPFEIKFKLVELCGKLKKREKVFASARKD